MNGRSNQELRPRKRIQQPNHAVRRSQKRKKTGRHKRAHQIRNRIAVAVGDDPVKMHSEATPPPHRKSSQRAYTSETKKGKSATNSMRSQDTTFFAVGSEKNDFCWLVTKIVLFRPFALRQNLRDLAHSASTSLKRIVPFGNVIGRGGGASLFCCIAGVVFFELCSITPVED